jgi:hypothetical protein
MMKYFRNWKYYAYRIYAELASRYYSYKDRNKPNPPPMVCQICGKGNHLERYCPNAGMMGLTDRKIKYKNNEL